MSETNLLNDDAKFLDADYDDEEPGWQISGGVNELTTEDHHDTDAKEEDDSRQIMAQMSAALEGLLFLSGDEGITLAQAAAALGTDEEYTLHLFDELQKYYLDDARGIEIAHFGDVWRFLSKASVHEYAKRLFSMEKETRLSNAALETLAIIAYKQPITRVEIEEIRGVGADVMLRKLEARGLIQESGRSEAPGRPILYSVTDDFMDAFSLLSLDELPDLPDFANEEGGSDELFRT